MIDTERLAFAFALAGRREALSMPAQRRLSTAGRALLDVCVEYPTVVRAIGLEATTRVWRRALLPCDRDQFIPTPACYAAALRLARAADHTTAQQLAAVTSPWALLDGARVA